MALGYNQHIYSPCINRSGDSISSKANMINKVTLKVLQYKLGDSLDKIRLPGNSRLLVTREDAAGGSQVLSTEQCC